MSENVLKNVRIVHKHDTEENWLKATNFIPKQGELIIYDVDDKYNYERMKIGDGETLVNDLSFIDVYVDEKIAAIPQANWNQNDETASDYIQGRTHYKTNVYKNVFDIIPTETEGATTLSSGKYRANLPVPSNSASNNYPNTNNILYCIVYNDVEYYRHAYSNNGHNYLGNMNIYNPALTDTGEPFYIMSEAYGVVNLYTRQAETFTIKIYEVEESTQYVQLDEKFIPDTIATKEYVDSNQTLKNIEEATRFVEKTKLTGFYFYLSNPLPNGWYYYEAEKYGNKRLNIVVVNKENTAVDKQVNINFPILFYLYSTEANIIVYAIQDNNTMDSYIYDIVNKTYDYYQSPSYNKAQVDKLLANKITTPNTAETGQFLTVKSIDENGKPTEWECIDSFDAAITNKQDKNMIVTITSTTADDGTKTYSADKTFEEIKNAINNGTNVYAKLASDTFNFLKLTNTNIWFNKYTPSSMLYQRIIITTNNSITYSSDFVVAKEYTYGGVKASAKSETDTIEAKIGEDGKLYVPEYPVTDAEISTESTNPVQNKVVKEYVDAAITNKADKTEVEALKTQVTATSLILADAITGQKYEIQIQNGQLVSFPIEE